MGVSPGATEEGDGADPPEPGPATGPPRGLVVAGREELLYLLGEAAEVEHAGCCGYLYAGFTLKTEPGDG